MQFSFKIGNELMNRGYLVISVYPVNAPQEKWTENLGPGLNPHKLWSSKTELTYLFEQALERLCRGNNPRIRAKALVGF